MQCYILNLALESLQFEGLTVCAAHAGADKMSHTFRKQFEMPVRQIFESETEVQLVDACYKYVLILCQDTVCHSENGLFKWTVVLQIVAYNRCCSSNSRLCVNVDLFSPPHGVWGCVVATLRVSVSLFPTALKTVQVHEAHWQLSYWNKDVNNCLLNQFRTKEILLCNYFHCLVWAS